MYIINKQIIPKTFGAKQNNSSIMGINNEISKTKNNRNIFSFEYLFILATSFSSSSSHLSIDIFLLLSKYYTFYVKCCQVYGFLAVT